MSVYVEEDDRAYEIGKEKPKTGLIKKGLGGKQINKKVINIRKKEISNKINSFKIKKGYKAIRTRSTRHGKDEKERECRLCDLHEIETWEHVMECKRTKEIRNIIDET